MKFKSFNEYTCLREADVQRPAPVPAQPAQNFQSQYMTVLNDMASLQQANMKLYKDSDVIVQGTKSQNNAVNMTIRVLAREVRDMAVSIHEQIKVANQKIQQITTGQ